jgi:hypothetical protein
MADNCVILFQRYTTAKSSLDTGNRNFSSDAIEILVDLDFAITSRVQHACHPGKWNGFGEKSPGKEKTRPKSAEFVGWC